MPAILKVRLEAVTPVLLGGIAPGDERDEFPVEPLSWRGSSLRGVLRFWFRAMCPDDVLERVRERRIFGDQEKAGQAQVLLRSSGEITKVRALRINDLKLRRFDVGSGAKTRSGLSYLAFPLLMRGNEGRRAIAPAAQWDLYLVSTRGDAHAHRAVAGALWLSCVFGGLGMRSRRGFGSTSLAAWSSAHPAWREVMDVLPLPAKAANEAELAKTIEQGLAAIRGWFPDDRDDPRLAPMPKLAGAKIRLGSITDAAGTDGWARALNAAGSELQRFRDHHPDDYSDVHDALVSRAQLERVPSRAAFGLPLSFRSSAQGSGRTTIVPRNGSARLERHASRLFLHVAKIRRGWVPIWSLLNAEWRSEQGSFELVEERYPRRRLGPPKHPDLASAFLDSLAGTKVR